MASSHPVAGDCVEHRAGEKTQADDYEKNIEHEDLTLSGAGSKASNRPGGIKVRYASAEGKIRIS
jgi:hypothetical protein